MTLVALVAVHFAHRWQVRQHVGAFLRLADAARDAKDGDEKAAEREIAYLKRYLMARPNENDVRERLARLLCESAKSGAALENAYLFVQDVLRRDPARDDLRRFAIDFAMNRLGLYAEALADIQILLDKRPADGELKAREARCFVHAKKYVDAGNSYTRAIDLRPDLVEVYPVWAGVLRLELNRGDEADQVVATMLEKNRGNFRAHLLVADYWRTFWGLGRNAAESAKQVAKVQGLKGDEDVGGAIADAVKKAHVLSPDELDVILAVSNVARFHSYELARSPDKEKRDRAAAAFAEAHRTLKSGLVKYPQSPALYLALAAREAEQRQEKDPVAVIKDGLGAIPDSPPLVLALLGYQILAGDAPGASETLDKLKSRGLAPTQAEFQEGRILMLKGKWHEAAAALEGVRNNIPDNSALGRETNLVLGRCYERLGMLDRRLAAFTRAIPTDTTDALWVPALQGVAEAEAALGKADAALQTYMRLKDRAAGAWVHVARLRMIKVLQTPADKNWSETEEALKNAELVLPKDNIEVRVLRATLLTAQGKPDKARELLEALKSEKPKDVAVRIALAAQYQRDGNLKQALDTLATAEKEIEDSPALRLARARLWADMDLKDKDPALAQKLESLAADADKFSPEQQRVLLRGLAELATAVTPGPLGGQLWDRLAKLQRYDLGVQLIRFDLALGAKDEDKIAHVLNEIRDVDGESGTSTRFSRAVYQIWRAQNKKEKNGLKEAELLLGGLERERNGWARVTFAQALVHDLNGDFPSAIVKYQKAVELGETNPDALRRLMELLQSSGRLDEAAAVLKKLPKASLADSEVQRLAAELSLRTNKAEALSYAERAVSDKSTDPADHIWLGQIYASAGEQTKADAAFRKAAALRPESLDGWLTLIQYLALTNRRGDGGKVLEEAQDKVAKPERALFLGLAYTTLGKGDKAGEAYKQARAERPTDLRTLRAEADFLLKYGKHDNDGQNAEAIEAFRRVIALPTASADDKDFARQMIVLSLASSPNYTVSRQALSDLGLLQGDQLRPLTGNETPAERRARIVALAFQRDRSSRLEAIKLLKAEGDKINPDDQFLLAQLYRSVGNTSEVRFVMNDLLQKNGQTARYVRFYAGWLLLINDHQAAAVWVKRLVELQPEALVTAELQARLAAAQVKRDGDLSAARAYIVPRADDPDAPLLAIASVCESIKLYEDAEQLFQRAVDKDKRPQAPLALAAFYGRRGQTAKALKICDEVRKTVPVPVVGKVAVEALYDSPAPSSADMNHVAEWLDEATKKATGGTKAVLVQLLASIRNLQGDYAGSMKLYASAIDANGQDVLALNNLAFLISAKEKNHDEALRLLDRAKKIRGPLPDFLDTEALVLLEKNELDRARQLLETVTAEAPSGTAFYHLARVELAAGGDHRSAAKQAWHKAQQLKIKLADLHPLERPEFTRVSELLK